MNLIRKTILYVLDHFEEGVVIVCMFGVTILTFAAVIARYVLRMPIAGADEVATFLFLWASLFGAAAAFKYNQHGGVPLLADRLPPGLRRVADLAVLLVTSAFFFFLAFYCWEFLQQSHRIGQVSPATGMPVWVINAGIFLALLMCGVRCVIPVIRDLAGLPRFPVRGAPDAIELARNDPHTSRPERLEP